MLISNVHIVGAEGLQQVLVEDGRIRSITENRFEAGAIEFNNAIAFPGLINSHDHLDFNLFPRLGNRIYNNYTEWGRDIHENNKEEIEHVLKIPQELRTQWGIYKNLLSGVTTVVNHGEKLLIKEEWISVLQDNYSLHSAGFEKNWKWKLNTSFKNKQRVVIHAGEGTDEGSAKEINELIRWNLFKKKMIAVHGVAMDAFQAKAFKALVWCPASNFFLLNKTAPVEKLKAATAIIFGTDSALTAGWNIWDHLRLARKQGSLSDEEIFNAVTKTAAAIWKLNDRGTIIKDAAADMVIAKANGFSWDSFYAVNPADILLLLKSGEPRLFDESVMDQLLNNGTDIKKFSRIVMGASVKYVEGDITGLIRKIKEFYPGALFPVTI